MSDTTSREPNAEIARASPDASRRTAVGALAVLFRRDAGRQFCTCPRRVGSAWSRAKLASNAHSTWRRASDGSVGQILSLRAHGRARGCAADRNRQPGMIAKERGERGCVKGTKTNWHGRAGLRAEDERGGASGSSSGRRLSDSCADNLNRKRRSSKHESPQSQFDKDKCGAEARYNVRRSRHASLTTRVGRLSREDLNHRTGLR